MKRKTVRLLVRGERYEVKGWGVNGLEGLTLTGLYRPSPDGTVEIGDKKVVLLVHDGSGKHVCFHVGGLKGLEEKLKGWKGLEIDWTQDQGTLLGTDSALEAARALAIGVENV